VDKPEKGFNACIQHSFDTEMNELLDHHSPIQRMTILEQLIGTNVTESPMMISNKQVREQSMSKH
jgi:hypothetical protein